MTAPLDGIKILDVTSALQGPYATTLLADLGADVLKIEDVPGGDMMRGVVMGKTEGILPPCSFNYHFELCNRGKKSVALDLRKPESREIVYKLARESDVFVASFRESALKRWGLDYESVKKAKPDIIYALATGYGLKGPDKDSRAFDTAAQARSGNLSLVGDADSPPPPWGFPWLADAAGALMLATSVITALFVRQRTGKGQKVSTSLLGAQIFLGAPQSVAYLASGIEPRRQSRTKAFNPLRNAYKTRDNKWLYLNMTVGDRFWPGLCKALEIPHLIDDERFNSNDARSKNTAQLVPLLDQAIALKTVDEWMTIFPRYDLVAGALRTFAEMASDPQVLANDYIIEVQHPTLGKLREPGCCIYFSETPAVSRGGAPEYGQHTEEVLLRIGYDWKDIERFKEMGVIA
ncbi:MAG: CoA transferase [Dehalococcoidia bacterium]|nr:CoA transferase [Dehalococcoidia bacterium]